MVRQSGREEKIPFYRLEARLLEPVCHVERLGSGALVSSPRNPDPGIQRLDANTPPVI